MNEYKRRFEDTERKVIKLHLDANFFFERAVRSLDRYRYDKALKYFQKAVEYEPDNPVNHCNMAGILSEMGDYEASNEALQTILNKIAPSMVECHFYMANNYANMEQFIEAQRELLLYMESDRDGQFSNEAEELMDLIHHELAQSGKKITPVSEVQHDWHAQARELMEKGQLQEACTVLLQILKQQPDHHAARNNLVVALYHQGELEQAADHLQQILDGDPYDLHALCNQAVLLRLTNQIEQLQHQIAVLRQIRPLHHEHVLKLAVTMGTLGEHETAYMHFRRLLKHEEWQHQTELYHYAAAAACYLGKYGQGEQLWRQMLRIDPEAKVAAFYLDHLEEVKQGSLHPSYQVVLPDTHRVNFYYTDRKPKPVSMYVRLLDILKQGTEDEQLAALQSYTLDSNRELHQELRAYAGNSQVPKKLRLAAERLLRQWAESQRLPAEHLIEDIESARAGLPVWDERWQQIVNEVMLQAKSYDPHFHHDVEALWLEFIKREYPVLPQMHHPKGWAAALEYLVARICRYPLTYEEVSQRYGVTSSIVSRYARRISRVCSVSQKVRSAQAENTKGS